MKRKTSNLMLMSLAMIASNGMNNIFDVPNPTNTVDKYESPKFVGGTNVVGRRHFSKKKRKLLNSKKK